jgi:hypothetical protein
MTVGRSMRKQEYILAAVIFTFSARYLALKAIIDTNLSNFKQFAPCIIKENKKFNHNNVFNIYYV